MIKFNCTVKDIVKEYNKRKKLAIMSKNALRGSGKSAEESFEYYSNVKVKYIDFFK